LLFAFTEMTDYHQNYETVVQNMKFLNKGLRCLNIFKSNRIKGEKISSMSLITILKLDNIVEKMDKDHWLFMLRRNNSEDLTNSC